PIGTHSATTGSYSVEWDQLPVGDAIERLRKVSNAKLFLDRRVDPSQRLKLSFSNARVDEIVAELTGAVEIGRCRVGDLYYLGPNQITDRLTALAALRSHEA